MQTVQPWTETRPLRWSGDELLVFSLSTPDTTNREAARQSVRRALRATLAPWLRCAAAEVPLVTQTGHALRLAVPELKIGLSVSHEPGISLVAINPGGAVGVDMLRLDRLEMADDELLRLAADYLGKNATRRIADLPLEQRRPAFAKAWIAFEAKLKCLGEGIAEYSPQRQALLDRCQLRELLLAKGVVGAVAISSPRA